MEKFKKVDDWRENKFQNKEVNVKETNKYF